MSAPEQLRFQTQDIVEQGGLAVTLSVRPERLFPEPQKEASAEGTLEVALEFSLGSDAILMTGEVRGGWRLACGRCLVEHARAYKAPVEETYPSDLESIDAAEPVREAALLEIPQRSLCRPDCKGLCPSCGKNLNEGPCGCKPQTGSPFQVLKRLKE